MIDLRPYQAEQINAARRELKHSRRVLLQLPTGGGKTRMSASMIAGSVANGKRCMFMVHQNELLHQTSRAYSALGIKHGIIASGQPTTAADVQIASLQTLINQFEAHQPPDVLFIDEAHRACASSYQHVKRWIGNKGYIIGLSASPERTSGEGLCDMFEVLMQGVAMRQLINDGFLCDYDIYSTPITHEQGQYADLVDTYDSMANGKQCVTMCSNIKHAKAVAGAYNERGICAAYIDGTMSFEVRSKLLADFEAGAIKVLTNVNLCVEGVDIPNIEVIQWARRTDSLIIWLQGIGRGLRPHASKLRLMILDHVGNFHIHGAPCDERIWSLDGKRSRERLESGRDVHVRLCDGCWSHYRLPAKECPYCSHVNVTDSKPIVVTKGELQKMEASGFRLCYEGMKRNEGWLGVVRYGAMRGFPDPVMWAVMKHDMGKPKKETITKMRGYYEQIKNR